MEDFRVFESLPGIMALVKADAPKFTILAVTDGFIQATCMRKEDIIGKGYFETFPESVENLNFTGDRNLRASYEHVIDRKALDHVPIHRFDRLTDTGGFSKKFWSSGNKPVLDESGNVLYIIQTAVEVTEKAWIEKVEVRVTENEKIHQLFQKAPVAICIVRGPDFVVELANEGMLQFLGRTADIVGKPIIDALPEARIQGLISILDHVFETGDTYYVSTFPATLLINGIKEVKYFDLIFHLYDPSLSDKNARSIFCVAQNVTEQVLARKKVEEVQEKLSFRNALFEALNEATQDGILIVDPDGKILLHNRRYEEIWKMPPEILNSRDDKKALEWAKTLIADPEGFVDRLNIVYIQRQPQGEDVILFNDGRVIERNGVPIIGEGNVYYGWAWYFRDVTDRIKQEQKFNNVVQQASAPILILKGENMVLEVANGALFDLWKVDGSAIGKPFLEILPEMEDQGFFELLQNVYKTGETFFGSEIPAVFERSTGQNETVYFNFSYQPYREADGSITGVLVLANDVTGQVLAKQKLIESEQNLRNTILQAPVAMCILKGPDHVVDIANNRMIEFWGKTSSDVLNKPVLEGVYEARNQGFEEQLFKVYYSGETVSAYGTPVTLSRNGKLETVYVSFVYEPFREWDGTISGIMVVVIDVTEQVIAKQRLEANEAELQKRVQERTLELNDINNELKRSNKDLEEFSYAASHDLKAPLRKINIFTERLKHELGEKLNENQIGIFKRIEHSTVRMLTLIDDLLTFSHITKAAFDPSEVDLNQKVRNVLEDLEVEVSEKNAKITVGNLPTVYGNKRQLQQLFQNLISNALKYTAPNVTPEIRISSRILLGNETDLHLRNEDDNKTFHLMQVQDNGIGFNQKDAEKIFKVFTRLHNNSEYSGTGIGLSIVQRVVENHNGKIWAESKPGHGATFKILLPAN